MTITTRLTTFFLMAMATVLIGFSLSMYLITHDALYEDAEEHLFSAMQTLVAAAQIRPDGVEEPPEWRVSVGGEGLLDTQIEWSVRNGQGRRIVSSAQYPAWRDPKTDDATAIPSDDPARKRDSHGRSWLRLSRTVGPKNATRTEISPIKHESLTITVVVSLEPIRQALTMMAITMTVVSLIVWLLSLFAGRWMCRRALKPVTSMADQARAMNADRLDERLRVSANHDELQSLGESFNGLLNRLQEAFERQSQFAGNASHQLRTPLAGIMGQVEVSLRHPRTAESYRETLVKVQSGGLQLRQIIESLLFLTRADHDALAAGFAPIDLVGAVDSWAAAREHSPRRADLRIEKPNAPLTVRAQPALLMQLLDNLFDNAVKYSPVDTPILLAIRRFEDRILLTIENRGTGIPPAEIDRVFEPFFRSEGARRSTVPGIGLGLAVVKRIVAAFGGTARVESELGRSTLFEISLPIAVEAATGQE